MFRIIYSKKVTRAPDEDVFYIEGSCSSTDTKPTEGICDGSKVEESDTGDVYFFNEDSETWIYQFSFQS